MKNRWPSKRASRPSSWSGAAMLVLLVCSFGGLLYLGYEEEALDEHAVFRPSKVQALITPIQPQILHMRDVPEFTGLLLEELEQYGEGNYTVFVLSDLALIKLAHAVFGDTGDWRNVQRLLPKVLPYYVVERSFLSSDVPLSRPIAIEALNRHHLIIKRDAKTGRLTVNGTALIETDLLALGRIVHFLKGDHVPPEVASAIHLDAKQAGPVSRVKKDASARRRGTVFETVHQTDEDIEEEGIVSDYLFSRAEIEAEELPDVDDGETWEG